MDFAASPFEIKTLSDDGSIEGLLAGFGNVDHGGDKLVAGCFTKTLAARSTPLPMLLYHDMARPVGAWKEWTEAKEGLYVKGRLTLAAKDAQEAHALAKDGALTGLSIGWMGIKETVDQRTGIRTITEAELFEGSLVSVPMNDRARVASVKAIHSPGDIEDLLRQCGLSGRKAKAAASAAWGTINQQDSDSAAQAELEAIFKASTARIAAI
jgi:HK97 family phage prohead protease